MVKWRAQKKKLENRCFLEFDYKQNKRTPKKSALSASQNNL